MVLSHQRQYREERLGTADQKPQVIIPSKPAAIYALRSYLRLCMPMTIETQINTIMTTLSRGGTDALDSGAPMISARSVGLFGDVNAPQNVLLIAGTEFVKLGCLPECDRDNVVQVSVRINLGHPTNNPGAINGLAERKRQLGIWKQEFGVA